MTTQSRNRASSAGKGWDVDLEDFMNFSSKVSKLIIAFFNAIVSVLGTIIVGLGDILVGGFSLTRIILYSPVSWLQPEAIAWGFSTGTSAISIRLFYNLRRNKDNAKWYDYIIPGCVQIVDTALDLMSVGHLLYQEVGFALTTPAGILVSFLVLLLCGLSEIILGFLLAEIAMKKEQEEDATHIGSGQNHNHNERERVPASRTVYSR